MQTLLEWITGHWWILATVVVALGIAWLILQTVVWILSHSD